MDAKLVVGIVVVVAIVAAGALVAMRGSGGGSSTTSTSPSSTSTGSAPSGGGASATATTSAAGSSTATTSTSEVHGVVVEGTWKGRYSGSHGSGEWTWVIRETGSSSYEGCLKTTGTYQSSGWMPISVQVTGDKITVGTVGGGAVVFTGTIHGSSASGEWRLVNGADSGSWEGKRTGPAGSLPCMGEATTSTTSSQPPSGGLTCKPAPPPSYQAAYSSLLQASIQVFGASNLRCITGVILAGGAQYAAHFDLQNYNPSEAASIASRLADAVKAAGWMNATVLSVGGDSFHVGAIGYGGQPFQALLSVQVNPDGTVDYTIQVQSAV